MVQTIKKPSPWLVILCGIGCALVYPFSILYAVVPALLAYLLLAGGAMYFACATLLGGLGLYALGTLAQPALAQPAQPSLLTLFTLHMNGVPVLYCLLGVVLAALLLHALLQKRRPYFESMLAVTLLLLLFFFFGMVAKDLMSGVPVYQTLQERLHAILGWLEEQNALYEQEMQFMMQFMSPLFGVQETSFEQVIQANYITVELLPLYMPAMLAVVSILLALSNTLLCARFCRNSKAQLRPVRRFMLWRLPNSFMQGMWVLVGGTLVLMLFESPMYEAVSNVVYAIWVVTFAIQGMSTYWFFISMRPNNELAKVALIVFLVIMSVLGVMLMAILGLIEQIFHLRSKAMRRMKGPK